MINKESLKLINTFLFSFMVAFSKLNIIFILPLLTILFIEKDYFFKILKKLFLLNLFIIILVIFVYFQNKTEALELFIRTNIILLFTISIFYKSQGYDIARGLDSLKFPSKIVSVLYFTISLIKYVQIDLKNTKNTLKSRGFIPNTSIFTYQTYGNIFAMIFIKILKKSEDIKISMCARGFKDKIFFLPSDKIKNTEIFLFVLIIIEVFYELFY